ncbi:MAG: hypothetical protein L6Q92_05670 [Phycisphaerae bacterium]|nr:hypothetical protein [Phycisphaerae bacterium]
MKRITSSVAVLCLAFASPVFAGAGDIALIDGSGLEFFINSDVTFSTSSASGAVSEASFTASVSATTSSGSPTLTTLSDAFDGYGAVEVDGTYYTNNGTPTMECNDRQLVYPVQTIGDLAVWRKVYVPDDDAFCRWVTFIRNDGAADAMITVFLDNNMGSDGGTNFVGTSDGDLEATTDDHWVISNGDEDDPRIVHVFSGVGGAIGVSNPNFVVGDDDTEWEYELTIAPGETCAVMHFVAGLPTKFEAILRALEMENVTPAMIACLTDEELQQIKNFLVGDCNENGINDADESDSDGDGIIDDCESGLFPICALFGGGPLLMMFGGYLLVLFARRRRMSW